MLVLVVVAIVGGLGGYLWGTFAVPSQDVASGESWSSEDLERVLLNLGELERLLDAGHDMYVYFWDPDCPFCQQADVILAPIGKDLDNFYMINVMEHYDAWDFYQIKGTPTLVHFRDGMEQERLVGLREEDEYRRFLQLN